MILTREQVDEHREWPQLTGDLGVLNLCDTIDARDAEIAALNEKLAQANRLINLNADQIVDQMHEIGDLKARIESWKREEVLRDEREAWKDARIAELERERDAWKALAMEANQRDWIPRIAGPVGAKTKDEMAPGVWFARYRELLAATPSPPNEGSGT